MERIMMSYSLFLSPAPYSKNMSSCSRAFSRIRVFRVKKLRKSSESNRRCRSASLNSLSVFTKFFLYECLTKLKDSRILVN